MDVYITDKINASLKAYRPDRGVFSEDRITPKEDVKFLVSDIIDNSSFMINTEGKERINAHKTDSGIMVSYINVRINMDENFFKWDCDFDNLKEASKNNINQIIKVINESDIGIKGLILIINDIGKACAILNTTWIDPKYRQEAENCIKGFIETKDIYSSFSYSYKEENSSYELSTNVILGRENQVKEREIFEDMIRFMSTIVALCDIAFLNSYRD